MLAHHGISRIDDSQLTTVNGAQDSAAFTKGYNGTPPFMQVINKLPYFRDDRGRSDGSTHANDPYIGPFATRVGQAIGSSSVADWGRGVTAATEAWRPGAGIPARP